MGWDMKPRADDDYCSCNAEGDMPVCPVTICPEGFFERDSCGCEEVEPIIHVDPPIDIDGGFVFECEPCKDGHVPEFPECLCETTVTMCDVCWDGSRPDYNE